MEEPRLQHPVSKRRVWFIGSMAMLASACTGTLLTTDAGDPTQETDAGDPVPAVDGGDPVPSIDGGDPLPGVEGGDRSPADAAEGDPTLQSDSDASTTVSPTNLEWVIVDGTHVKLTWEYEDNTKLYTGQDAIRWAHNWQVAPFADDGSNVIATSPDGNSMVDFSASNPHVDSSTFGPGGTELNGPKIFNHPSPRIAGHTTALYAWGTGQGGQTTSFRQEIEAGFGNTQVDLYDETDHCWWGFSVHVPSSVYIGNNPAARTSIMQSICSPDPGTQPFFLSIDNTQSQGWNVNVAGTGMGDAQLREFAIPEDLDRNIDVVAAFKHGANGYLNVWIDGELLYDDTAPNWNTGQTQFRSKFGLYASGYKNQTNAGQHGVYFSSVIHARSKSDEDLYRLVAPSPCHRFFLELWQDGTKIADAPRLHPGTREYTFTVASTAGKDYSSSRVAAALYDEISAWVHASGP